MTVDIKKGIFASVTEALREDDVQMLFEIKEQVEDLLMTEEEKIEILEMVDEVIKLLDHA